MTRNEVINRAAEWWFSMIKTGHWDNGDSYTEGMRGVFKSFAYQPTEEDFAKLKPGLVEMVKEQLDYDEGQTYFSRSSIYADYHCHQLDQLYKRLGLKMDSMFHSPQKAGTNITKNEQGEYQVEVKSGYGGPWEKI